MFFYFNRLVEEFFEVILDQIIFLTFIELYVVVLELYTVQVVLVKETVQKCQKLLSSDASQLLFRHF